MKKVTIPFLLCILFVVSKAQDQIPLPEFVNSFYIITPTGLVSLEKQEASTKTKMKAASFFTVFAIGTKSSAILKEAKSPVRTKGKIQLIYEPSIMADPSQAIKIIPLNSDEKKEIRWIETGKSSLFRVKNNDVPSVNFTYKKYKEKYIIIDIENIAAGEYGIVYASTNQLTGNLQYQLFGIDE